jgi:hypothetical protein
VTRAKDSPITIRLDSESRSKLEKLAAEQGLGSSTFARRILMVAMEQGIQEWLELGLKAVCIWLAWLPDNAYQLITKQHPKYREVKALLGGENDF